jgi:hypothetical protein
VRLSDVSASHDDVERLLSEAHVLRMQGQVDEAIALCTRVLRMDPANAAAPSLLGDIYREQENYREALGWYKLAVQLNPHNTADRRKLDEMIDRVFRGARPEADGTAVLAINPNATPPPAGQYHPAPAERRNLLAHIQPIHMVIACTIIAMAVGLLLMLGAGHEARSNAGAPTQPIVQPAHGAEPAPVAPTGTEPATGSAVVADPQVPDATPRVSPPAPDKVESGGTRIPGLPGLIIMRDNGKTSIKKDPNPPALTNPNTAPEIPPYPVSDGPLSADEVARHTQRMQAAMQLRLKEKAPYAVLRTFTLDPRTATATIDYTIPRTQSTLTAKQALLYIGFNLVWAGLDASRSVKTFTLRGYAYGAGTEPTLAFIADVLPQQADTARGAGDYRSIAGYLGQPWWRADLAPVAL